MRLALRARVRGLTNAAIDKAISVERSLVRIWALRGTLHLLAAADVRWIVALLGPSLRAAGKRRRLQLGLDEEKTARGQQLLRSLMHKQGPLNRSELVARLADRGFELDRKSQAPIHLIGAGALDGILCLGPDEPNGENTYVLMDEWVVADGGPAGGLARSELARRYLASYGPADVRDFAAWSGLTLGEARQGWPAEDALVTFECEGKILSLLKAGGPQQWRAAARKPVVNLLPAFDTYLLGYADRTQIVAPEHHSEVYHGGQVVPVVLVDGLAAGVWRYERTGKRLTISVRAFGKFDTLIAERIEAEAEEIGRFWEMPVEVRIG
jgi:hypothetical protein